MALSPSFLEAASALIRADTVSARGTAAAADLLQPLYEQAGLRVGRQAVRASLDGGAEAEHVNVLAGPGGCADGPGGLLLVTHLDTVPPGPRERWTETAGDPWALTEREGVLFGLGCADVKLDALCKAEAARRLRGRKLARPFWLLGTYGEEVGLRGARHFARSELWERLRPRHVLCGEPSELVPIAAHKGYAVVRCEVIDARARLVSSAGPGVEELEFEGQAAHSSTPHLGRNAIHRALLWARSGGTPILRARGGTSTNVVPARCTLWVPAPRETQAGAPDQARSRPALPAGPNLWRALATLSALEDLWRELLSALRPAADARFDPPGALGALNLLEADGEAAPDGAGLRGTGRAAGWMDARLLPEHDPDALLQAFTGRAQEWVQALGQGELSLRVSVERNAAGLAPSPDSALLRALSRALAAHGLPGESRAKPTSTEAGVFARAGAEAAVFGPGRSTGNAHTANERIEVAQLERAVDVYESLILDLCGGHGPCT